MIVRNLAKKRIGWGHVVLITKEIRSNWRSFKFVSNENCNWIPNPLKSFFKTLFKIFLRREKIVRGVLVTSSGKWHILYDFLVATSQHVFIFWLVWMKRLFQILILKNLENLKFKNVKNNKSDINWHSFDFDQKLKKY